MTYVEPLTIDFLALDPLPIGVCVLRENMEVVFWNRCLEDWTGIRRDEIVGTALHRRFINLAEPLYMSRFNDVLAGGPPTVFSETLHPQLLPAKLPAGGKMIQNSMLTYLGCSGQEDLAMLVVQDVTALTRQVHDYRKVNRQVIEELRRREETQATLQRQQLELARSNADLEQFANVVSHDLQAPLRRLVGLVQLLCRRYGAKLDAKADELLTHVEEAATRMQSLVADLLEFSRAGTGELKLEWCDLAGIVDEILSDIEPMVAEKHARFYRAGLGRVWANRTQMRQLLQNLICNAITNCGAGPPEVTIGFEDHDTSWIISVSDNGIGIPPESRERIFKIFQRLHATGTSAGTGIGLSICKRIAERHGGEITVQSQPGAGSVFSFTLPKTAHEK